MDFSKYFFFLHFLLPHIATKHPDTVAYVVKTAWDLHQTHTHRQVSERLHLLLNLRPRFVASSSVVQTADGSPTSATSTCVSGGMSVLFFHESWIICSCKDEILFSCFPFSDAGRRNELRCLTLFWCINRRLYWTTEQVQVVWCSSTGLRCIP